MNMENTTTIQTRLTSIPYKVGETILRISDLSKDFNGKIILRDVNFEVKDLVREGMNQGQIVSIIGRSGGGKTTMAKIIAGILKPTTGTVLVCNGHERPLKRGEVGFVFQDSIVFDHLTVYDNLLLAAYQGMTREHAEDGATIHFFRRQYTWLSAKTYKLRNCSMQRKGDGIIARFLRRSLAALLKNHYTKHILWEKVDECMAEFDLAEHADKNPNQLSGGQKQRLATAMQVLCSNQFIVFDEPFSGQDPERKRKACEVIKKLAQKDEYKTLFIITHDIRSALWVSDMIIILGRERDDSGAFKPGSTVFEPVDIAKRQLAWRDASILRDPEFQKLADEIEFDWMPNM